MTPEEPDRPNESYQQEVDRRLPIPTKVFEFIRLPVGTKHPSLHDPEKLLGDCRITQTRRSGPGGQHRNKTSTAIVIEHLPTGIRGEAAERRSQIENRQMALKRLRDTLALRVRSALKDPRDREEVACFRKKYSAAKIQISEKNPDFSAFLSIVLDDIDFFTGEMRPVAQLWNSSPSQLIRILKLLPQALVITNAIRQSHHQKPLR